MTDVPSDWCSLSEDEKNEVLQTIVPDLKSNTPVLIARNEQLIKWDRSSNTYRCGHCDPKNSSEFQKIVDTYCFIGKIVSQYRINFNYTTPAVQYLKQEPKDIRDYKEEIPVQYIRKTLSDIGFQSRSGQGDYVTSSRVNAKGKTVNTEYFVFNGFWPDDTPIIYYINAAALNLFRNEWAKEDIQKSLFGPNPVQQGDWNKAVSVVSSISEDKLNPIPGIYKTYSDNNVKLLQKESIRLFASFYKIHIQPKQEYMLWVLYHTLRLLSNSQDVYAIKANITYERSVGITESDPGTDSVPLAEAGNLPIIVIYLTMGRLSFERTISLLSGFFQSYNYLGLGIAPRYNSPYTDPITGSVSNLLYYSTGDGDFKLYLGINNLLDTYFDKSTNYSKLKREFL